MQKFAAIFFTMALWLLAAVFAMTLWLLGAFASHAQNASDSVKSEDPPYQFGREIVDVSFRSSRLLQGTRRIEMPC